FLRWRPPILLVVFLDFKRMCRTKNVCGAFTLFLHGTGPRLVSSRLRTSSPNRGGVVLGLSDPAVCACRTRESKNPVPNILGFTVNRFEEDDSASHLSVCELR